MNVGPAVYLWWHPSDEVDDEQGGFDRRRIKRCVVAPYRLKPRYEKMVLGSLLALARIGANRTFFSGGVRGGGYCKTTVWESDRAHCSLEEPGFFSKPSDREVREAEERRRSECLFQIKTVKDLYGDSWEQALMTWAKDNCRDEIRRAR